jgi:phosphoserine aminotransferase
VSRVFNFSAGPAALPEAVLEQAQAELLDYRGTGMSVMEMSHRSGAFVEIAEQAEADLIELLAIPDEYQVLFLQGGATTQFAMVPLNLLDGAVRADYVNTGSWSSKAIAEAQRFCDVNVAASSGNSNFDRVPDPADWVLSSDAAYLHICSNETIGGVQFHELPERSDCPLVADMSSDILSRPIDVSCFDAKADSMSNTPPTFAWYLAGLVFRWLKAEGGLEAMAQNNARKANKLYDAIDNSNFYRSPVAVDSRSWMNVPFTLPDPELDSAFLAGAEAAGLTNLKGHRSVGGMRASIYNAVPEAAVDALIEFMSGFENEQG